jgi:hypothetical protein|tara:strand:- start:210 stop:377 length:168 start_codon:yes stop_codon:yes gene_type:complete
MQVGDLVRMHHETMWLVACVVGDDALLQNLKTSTRHWVTWNLTHGTLNYEVVSAA